MNILLQYVLTYHCNTESVWITLLCASIYALGVECYCLWHWWGLDSQLVFVWLAVLWKILGIVFKTGWLSVLQGWSAWLGSTMICLFVVGLFGWHWQIYIYYGIQTKYVCISKTARESIQKCVPRAATCFGPLHFWILRASVWGCYRFTLLLSVTEEVSKAKPWNTPGPESGQSGPDTQ